MRDSRTGGRAEPPNGLPGSSSATIPLPGTISGSDHDPALAHGGASAPVPAQPHGAPVGPLCLIFMDSL